MSCATICMNYGIKCAKCNGKLYLKTCKPTQPKIYKSNRKGASLEQATVRMRPNSGATRHQKGDCIGNHSIIECKSTGNSSIRITQDMLDKIDCYSRREISTIPVINFSLNDNDNEIYSIIKYRDLLALIQEASMNSK